MILAEALDIVITRTKHERFRWLCSEDNPDIEQREAYRAQVMAMASGERLQYPPLWRQAVNAATAAGRAIASGFASVSEDERDRRLLICMDCEHYDHAQERCTKCGCFGRWKTFLATEHCPLPEPKW